MNQKLLLLFGPLLLTGALFSQEIVPLSGYEQLERPTKRSTTPVKMDCFPDLNTFTVIVAGDSSRITIEADTVGYPEGSAFFCLNCGDNRPAFGDLIPTEEGFTYRSDLSVEQGIDTLELAFCLPTGDSCTVSETVRVLVQRAARSFSFPVTVLDPQERIEVMVPAAELPGGVSCRTFSDCEDDYPESGQEALFLFDADFSNDFRYEAARLAGIDLVCLDLCNEFGLCDRYTFPFRVERQNVNLPFFDDFSRDELRPNLALWQNEDVLINRTFGIEPPSLGVATFDAVDSRGRPYPISGGQFIPRDYLTSSGINMAGSTGATLSFYAQPRGNGNRPEVQDSLVLQFRQQNGNWQTVWSQAGLSSGEGNCTDRPFLGYVIDVDPEFNYNGFQFRFFNRSNQVGSLDHWHLDYVKLDDVFTSLNLDDIALIREPGPVVRPYSAMPYRQFVAGGADLVNPMVEVAVWNHAAPDPFLPATQSNFNIRELRTDRTLLNTVLFRSLDAVPAAEPFIGTEILSDLQGSLFTNYRNTLLDLPNAGDETYRVSKVFNLNSNTSTFNEVGLPGYAPWVSANNRAERVTVFDDYYAYDDGTAELAAFALPGQTVVQRYETFMAESLTGVSIRLPRTTGSTASQLIRLVVYLDSLIDDQPDYALDVNPIYPEDFYRDSLQGFTSYAFPEPIELPAGVFYVGWQQLTDCQECVTVGLDRNTIVSGTRFFNNGGNWFPFDGCSTGALMIRPLVGDSPVLETDVEDPTVAGAELLLFPNPTTDEARLRRTDGQSVASLDWTLYSVTGRQVRMGRGDQPIRVSDLPAGVYWLRSVDRLTGAGHQQKLLVE